MSAATTLLPSQAVYTNEPIYRLTVDQYHELIGRGILTPDDPVELLEGVLVFKMPKKSPHATAVRKCRRAIQAVITPSFFYDAEQPLTLLDGEPEPDGMIVRGTIEDYEDAHLGPGDVELIVEIADSTLDRDRGIKLRSYARAGIFCYWIVNLIDRQVEVYTQPDVTAAPPTYRRHEVIRADGTLMLSLEGKSISNVSVADLLPAS